MDILIHSSHVTVTPKLRQLVLRRVHFAMDRHADHIDRVQVWLSEEGMHSGEHQRCRLVVHTLPHGTVVVEKTCHIQEAAISRAAEDCERAVRRRIERRRSGRRRRAA